MNIYVLTANYYFYAGLESLIYKTTLGKCHQLTDLQEDAFYKGHHSRQDDVFVVVIETFLLDIMMMLRLREKGIVIAVIAESRKITLLASCGLATLPYHFSVENLLMVIEREARKKRSAPVLRLTLLERAVLLRLSSGMGVRRIGEELGIDDKKVYACRRSILLKTGLNKSHNIALLPIDYINYLCAELRV